MAVGSQRLVWKSAKASFPLSWLHLEVTACLRTWEHIPLWTMNGSPVLLLPGTISSIDFSDNVEMSLYVVQSLVPPHPCSRVFQKSQQFMLHMCTRHSIASTTVLKQSFLAEVDGALILQEEKTAPGVSAWEWVHFVSSYGIGQNHLRFHVHDTRLSIHRDRLTYIKSSPNPLRRVQISRYIGKFVFCVCIFHSSGCYLFLAQSLEKRNNGVLPYNMQTPSKLTCNVPQSKYLISWHFIVSKSSLVSSFSSNITNRRRVHE